MPYSVNCAKASFNPNRCAGLRGCASEIFPEPWERRHPAGVFVIETRRQDGGAPRDCKGAKNLRCALCFTAGPQRRKPERIGNLTAKNAESGRTRNAERETRKSFFTSSTNSPTLHATSCVSLRFRNRDAAICSSAW